MFAPTQLPRCPELKPDVTPPATPALQPLRSDHDLMAPLNPENRRTGTGHHVTQSVAEPLRQPGHPGGSAMAPSLWASVGSIGAAPAAGLFSNANPRRGIYSALIPAEPILG